MTTELIKQLLEAGVHFGHQTKRWNPKMKKFIFGERSKIYIIDLEKTAECLNKARDFLNDIATQGGNVLFVGTKKQAQDVIEQEALRCEMFFVRYRWLGGLLTNFKTITKSVERLNDIEEMETNGIFQKLTKKEVARLSKERSKLLRDLSGIRDMGSLPQAIIIVDSMKEAIAVREANRLNIPIVGVIDTNCNPDAIDYPVPGNDDALKSVRFIISQLTEGILEGRKKFLVAEGVKKKAAAAKAADIGKPGEVEIPKEEIESLEESVEKEKEGDEKKGPVKVKLRREK